MKISSILIGISPILVVLGIVLIVFMIKGIKHIYDTMNYKTILKIRMVIHYILMISICFIAGSIVYSCNIDKGGDEVVKIALLFMATLFLIMNVFYHCDTIDNWLEKRKKE